MYNKSATLKIEFNVGEDNVAKFDYNVGIGDVNIAVTLDKARQDVILADSTGAKTTFTLDLGDYGAEDCTLTKVTYGSVALDVTEDGKVTITDALKNATHGEANLLAVVSKERTVYSITVPVTIVTETFSTVDAIIANIGYHVSASGETHKGKYYTLADNISYSGSYACYKQDTTDAIGAQGNNNGFAGTFDGRNYTITGGNMYGGGLFGALSNATIKNIKFVNVNLVGVNRTLIAASIWNSMLENISITASANKVDVPVPQYYFGVIASGHCNGVTLKDISIDLGASSVPWIFGRGSGNGTSSNYTFNNVQIKAASILCLGESSETGAARLYFNQVPGVKFNFSGSSITAPAGTEIDPKAENFEFALSDPWSKFTAVKSVSIVLGDNAPVVLEVSDISITTDGKLKFSGIKDQLTTEMYNETVTLKIEFDVGEDNVAKFDYKVSVGDVNVEAKLTDRQDVILKDSTGAKTTFTLNLGDYAGGTLGDVRCGTNVLEKAADGSIKTDALQNVTHGETNLTAVVTKDGVIYTLTVPVTIVTETFSNVRTIIDTIGYKSTDSGKTHEGKYYTLAGDVSYSESYSGNIQQTGLGNGFAGTFDGRDYTITGGKMYGGGLFGSLEGATIKNIKFVNIDPVGINSTLIAGSAFNTTFENISIKTSISVTVTGNESDFVFFGVISSHRAANLTLKDVSVDMGESEIPWIFGKGWDNASASNSFTCENVVINLKSLKCLTMNSNSDGLMIANNAVTGITVNESSKTEG